VEHLVLAEFLRFNPPKYNGVVTHDQADQWIRMVEKIFKAISCREDKKLVFATYMLFGEAEF